MLDNNNNNDHVVSAEQLQQEGNHNDSHAKPHVVRRNIEDYLERRALERRLRDVFDDDFLLD